MKNGMRAYFREHFRSNLRALLCIITISLLITFVFAGTLQIRVTSGVKYGVSATIGVPVYILTVCSYMLPPMEFSIFKKRRNLDCFYALPIDRKKIALVHYLTGMIMVTVPFTLSYILNALLLLRAPSSFDFMPLLPHYLISIALGISQYSLCVFVFNRANTTGDGIWFMILWTFVLLMIGSTLSELYGSIFGLFDDIFENNALIIWGLLGDITDSYAYLIRRLPKYAFRLPFGQNWHPETIYSMIFYLLCGISAAFASITAFGKSRAENTEEISDSWFGYKLLIPVYAITGMIILSANEIAVLWLFVEIMAFVGYTIYRRGFHYKKSDLIILALLVFFLFIPS